MGTSSPMVPILSTEIFPIPAITKSYGEFPLKVQDREVRQFSRLLVREFSHGQKVIYVLQSVLKKIM